MSKLSRREHEAQPYTVVTPAWQGAPAVSNDRGELNEHHLNDSYPGKETANQICLAVLIHALRGCAVSMCWQCKVLMKSPVSSCCMEASEGGVIFSFFHSPPPLSFSCPPIFFSLFSLALLYLYRLSVFLSLLEHSNRLCRGTVNLEKICYGNK